MLKWKAPPKAKVYEALGAVLDGRVKLGEEGQAEVESSTRDKSYTVQWTEGTNLINSNDNASFYQGYIGYPIIAILLATKKIPFDRELAKPLAGVHWKAINDRFKRNYEAALGEVLSESRVSEQDRQALEAMVDRILDEVIKLDLGRPAGQSMPPPGK